MAIQQLIKGETDWHEKINSNFEELQNGNDGVVLYEGSPLPADQKTLQLNITSNELIKYSKMKLEWQNSSNMYYFAGTNGRYIYYTSVYLNASELSIKTLEIDDVANNNKSMIRLWRKMVQTNGTEYPPSENASYVTLASPLNGVKKVTIYR